MSARGPQQKVNLSHHALQSAISDRFSYEKCQILHKLKKASTENVKPKKEKKSFRYPEFEGYSTFSKEKDSY